MVCCECCLTCTVYFLVRYFICLFVCLFVCFLRNYVNAGIYHLPLLQGSPASVSVSSENSVKHLVEKRITSNHGEIASIRTCDGWPNGFASRLSSSRQSQKAVNFTHIHMTCGQLVSTCVGWPNGEKLALTCVRI